MATVKLESGVYFRRDSSGRMAKYCPGDTLEVTPGQLRSLGNKVSLLGEEKASVGVPPTGSPGIPATAEEPEPAETLPSVPVTEPEPPAPPETTENCDEAAEVAMGVGGGWYRLPDGSKVRKREAQSLGYVLE